MKILLVEDHVAVSKTTTLLLKRLGHEVCTARTGQEALDSADEFGPDLMLIDIGLPDMTGHEVCGEIRRRPQHGGTVLVAVTGYDCQDKAMDSGFDYWYKKPMDFTLMAELQNLEKRHLERT